VHQVPGGVAPGAGCGLRPRIDADGLTLLGALVVCPLLLGGRGCRRHSGGVPAAWNGDVLVGHGKRMLPRTKGTRGVGCEWAERAQGEPSMRGEVVHEAASVTPRQTMRVLSGSPPVMACASMQVTDHPTTHPRRRVPTLSVTARRPPQNESGSVPADIEVVPAERRRLGPRVRRGGGGACFEVLRRRASAVQGGVLRASGEDVATGRSRPARGRRMVRRVR